ncbi:MAG: methyltransferase [Thermoanaerobaculales bacterium]
MARLPMAIPAELRALTADLPDHIIDDAFRCATERLDRFIGSLAVETGDRLGLLPGELLDLDTLFAARGWSPAGRLAVGCLLETFELYGLAKRTESGWWLERDGEMPPAAALRADAQQLMPASAPAYAVLELAAQALPAVLRGELRGEEALFSPATLGLWFEYFSNTNPHYAPNNAIAALAMARSAPARPSVFEVGGGAGSAAEALLAELAEAGKVPVRYVFTEPQPAFLRRASRLLGSQVPAGCLLQTARYDVNGEPSEQGVSEGEFDVVLGVNVLHLAHELVPALSRLRRLLRPGGVLVLGELLRPSPTAAVHLELPFALLAEYCRPPANDDPRERPGFASVAGWRRALAAAGFCEVRVLPALIERCAEIYPGFYCGALTARAPS